MAEQRVIDGVQVMIDGQGPQTMVMVHGWPDTWRLWDEQVQALQGRWRCVRFSLPGFDETTPRRARSLDELVATLRAIVQVVSPDQPVVMLLHDWGCIFGYHFCQKHPELVSRIIGVDVGDANSAEHAAELTLKAKLGIFGYQVWLAAAWCLGGRLGDRMTRGMARALRCRSDAQYIGARMNYPYFIQWSGSHGSYRALRPLQPHCPMLYLYGARKPFMFHSQAWLQALGRDPQNRVLALPTGHWVMSAQPQAFNEAVLAWL